LLTYAAGLKAVTIVWIAERFTEEHRATLDWLNDITDERFNFFGLEVELWRIDNSAVAPKFNVVCKPNDWSKTVKTGATQLEVEALTDKKQLQLEFWTSFREHSLDQVTIIKPTKPLPQHWMNISLGRTGFRLQAIASFYDSVAETFDNHELRAELVIETDKSKLYFAMLADKKSSIEAQLGEQLTWHSPEGKRMCRIYSRCPADIDCRARWPEYHAWLLDQLERFHQVFGPMVKQLNADELPIGST
jgi:hypothetical protein